MATSKNGKTTWVFRGTVAFVVLAAVFLVWLGFISWWPGNVEDPANAATSLFSALAFAAVILTLWMQQEELSLQHNELEETRKELRAQSESLRESLKFHAKQLETQTKATILSGHIALLEGASAARVAKAQLVADYHVDHRQKAMVHVENAVEKFAKEVMDRIKDLEQGFPPEHSTETPA